ncbi:hypothetical protein IE53DRAFT_366860 [Violaceomyces palustris]|uniref:Uncharacterized protein n=1 Tax=Violaceomyces palustris TaxID=1673888 RepID=A0ACD0P498_9BASI|nr:hypothetical protein IE53DRAFT_366860 [Violaceomyces palustris]
MLTLRSTTTLLAFLLVSSLAKVGVNSSPLLATCLISCGSQRHGDKNCVAVEPNRPKFACGCPCVVCDDGNVYAPDLAQSGSTQPLGQGLASDCSALQDLNQCIWLSETMRRCNRVCQGGQDPDQDCACYEDGNN